MFRYLINIGVSALNTATLNRKIRICNLVAIAIILSMLGYILTEIKFHIPATFILNVIFLFFALLNFFLQARGWHQTAFHTLSAYCILQFTISPVFYGLAANIHFFQLIIALVVIVLFEKKNVLYVYFGLIFISFFSVIIVMSNRPGIIFLPEEIRQTLLTFNVVNLFLLFSICLTFFIFFKQDSLSFQKAIVGQTEIIEHQQRELMDSINYARRIQYALMSNKDLLEQNLTEHFLLFKPKEVVSGDFYWATVKQDKFYLAVCDSSGHGVPGAFMSLLDIGLLSEAINDLNIAEPHDVLNFVKNGVMKSMSKAEGTESMDGILLCLDRSAGTVTYASAKNNPVLIRDNHFIELPKSETPANNDEKNGFFALYKLNIQKGDCLYLSTDGYQNQLGGPLCKKFTHAHFGKLLLKNYRRSLKDQSLILNKKFDEWKGQLEQSDDVLIVGIKF